MLANATTMMLNSTMLMMSTNTTASTKKKADMGVIIYSSVRPMFKIYLIIGTGFLLARLDILSAAATKSISNIVLLVLLPSLSFYNIVTNIKDSDIKYVGIICLSSAILFLTGGFFAYVIRKFLPCPKKWNGGIIAGGMFPNISDLPIAYLQTMSNSGAIFTTEEGNMGVAYVIIFVAMFLMCVFNLGGYKLIENDFDYKDEENAIRDNESFQDVVNIENINTSESFASSSSSSSTITSFEKETIKESTPPGKKFASKLPILPDNLESIHSAPSFHNNHQHLDISQKSMLDNSMRTSIEMSSIDSNPSNDSNTPQFSSLQSISSKSRAESVAQYLKNNDSSSATILPNLKKANTQPNPKLKLGKINSSNSNYLRKFVSAYSTGSIYNHYRPHNKDDPTNKNKLTKVPSRRHKPAAMDHDLIKIFSNVNQYGEKITPLYSRPYPEEIDNDEEDQEKRSQKSQEIYNKQPNNDFSIGERVTTSPALQKYQRNNATKISNAKETPPIQVPPPHKKYPWTYIKDINYKGLLFFFLSNCLRPVSLAVICSLTICFIPWVKAIFVKPGAPHVHEAPDGQPILAFIMDYANYLGAASVPFGLLLLGATLGRLKITRLYPGFWKTAVLLVVLRQCVIPIFGVLWCDRLVKAGWVNWEKDSMLLYVIAINSGLPTMTTLIYFTASYTPLDCEDPVQMECVSFFLMIQYPLLLVSLPFLSTYFLKVQMNL